MSLHTLKLGKLPNLYLFGCAMSGLTEFALKRAFE